MQHVLIVDDEEIVRELNREILARKGYQCTLAGSAADARVCMQSQKFDLILCDINMPGESGLEFIKFAMVEDPEVAAIMLTGYDDPSVAENAFLSGVYDFLPKPIEPKRLMISVSNALHRQTLERANRSYQRDLEDRVEDRTKALQNSLDGVIKAMAITIEMRDPYTAGHQNRVANLACRIALKMALDKPMIEGIRMGGIIHDLGKISVPAEILSKPGRLSTHEFGLIQAHPVTGFEILKDIIFPWPVSQIVRQHHERCDGSGYPDGLTRDRISIEARILCVADVVEAMASHRPYRPSLGNEKALAEIEKNKGKLYDSAGRRSLPGCL